MKFTNLEFIHYLNKTFKDPYQIGLHSINIGNYYKMVREDGGEKRFLINEKSLADINENDIATHILQNGLFVFETYRGLCSTVNFLNSDYTIEKKQIISETKTKSFDYNFLNPYTEADFIYNIVIALPNYLTLNKKQYFIGEFGIEIHNLGNSVLFNKTLPSTFILGFYQKEIKSIMGRDGYLRECSPYLDFHLNKNHYCFKTNEQKSNITKQILETTGYNQNLLETITSDKKEYKYFKESYSIYRTQEQKEQFEAKIKQKR